jgi:hypothetical protein
MRKRHMDGSPGRPVERRNKWRGGARDYTHHGRNDPWQKRKTTRGKDDVNNASARTTSSCSTPLFRPPRWIHGSLACRGVDRTEGCKMRTYRRAPCRGARRTSSSNGHRGAHASMSALPLARRVVIIPRHSFLKRTRCSPKRCRARFIAGARGGLGDLTGSARASRHLIG